MFINPKRIIQNHGLQYKLLSYIFYRRLISIFYLTFLSINKYIYMYIFFFFLIFNFNIFFIIILYSAMCIDDVGMLL